MIIQIGPHTVAINPQYEAGIIAMYANINKDRRRIKREFWKAMKLDDGSFNYHKLG